MNHKSVPKLGITLLLAIVVVLVSVVPASAKAERIYITGSTCIQTQGPPERFWISEDGIMHMRGIITSNIDVTDSPYDTGSASMIMNIDIDPTTGYGHAFGTFTIYPTNIQWHMGRSLVYTYITRWCQGVGNRARYRRAGRLCKYSTICHRQTPAIHARSATSSY